MITDKLNLIRYCWTDPDSLFPAAGEDPEGRSAAAGAAGAADQRVGGVLHKLQDMPTNPIMHQFLTRNTGGGAVCALRLFLLLEYFSFPQFASADTHLINPAP